MSNKQKFLTVLATMMQPRARNPKHSWTSTEKAWEENYALTIQLTNEELAEIVTYLAMGLNCLSHERPVDIFHDVMLDDIRTILHDRTCPRCKDMKTDDCSAEADAAPEATLREMSFDDLMATINKSRPQ